MVYFLKSNIWTIGNVMLDTHTNHSNPSSTIPLQILKPNIKNPPPQTNRKRRKSVCVIEKWFLSSLEKWALTFWIVQVKFRAHTHKHAHRGVKTSALASELALATVNAAHFLSKLCSLRMFREGWQVSVLCGLPHNPAAWNTGNISLLSVYVSDTHPPS